MIFSGSHAGAWEPEKWLNRRSQRRSYTCNAFNDLIRHFNLLRPRIIKKTTQLRLGF
ncbi:hypothetical protein THIOM_001956 [Candidatus Thiomargarita nelsonii]|uniref:Uncharacterized protein n=1 Tax=Candidatus Thiomargarita nelsonii TaxID=1003181 RepID=A0A176S2U7_9GAMM|nr:hypothetical protein THIOM_001956 [Candidatus Thiomargarita nelsonii]